MKALYLVKIQYEFRIIKYAKDLPRFFLHVGYFPIIFLMGISLRLLQSADALTIWEGTIVSLSIFFAFAIFFW